MEITVGNDNSNGEIVLYQPDKSIRLEVRIADDTVWLSQAQMAELFKTTPQNITIHIKNIYREFELEKEATCKDYLQVQREGKRVIRRAQKFYNLDVIISVGYRVKSIYGTRFRQWANAILKEYLLKGYSINNRIEHLEQRVYKTEEKIDFFIKTSLPPKQGIFYDGQVFDRSHDRFLLIDEEVYHIGATLKDLEKKRPGKIRTAFRIIAEQFLFVALDGCLRGCKAGDRNAER
ncbi:MAG: virulence RhuM family protein [Bacteroidales bacterium]|nr:virulence RhuM family protein [Bacteroidales bacterium]